MGGGGGGIPGILTCLPISLQCTTALQEREWVGTELKNSLRSIEWDLEDLEDTVDNKHKFNLRTIFYFCSGSNS